MMERLCLGGSVADLVGLGKILDGPAIPPRLTTMSAFSCGEAAEGPRSAREVGRAQAQPRAAGI